MKLAKVIKNRDHHANAKSGCLSGFTKRW
jgi:hypothetical protein